MRSNLDTAIGLFNGMVGSVILILPLQFLHYGITRSIHVVVLGAVINFISCAVILSHLGSSQSTLQECLDRHNKQSSRLKFINIVNFVSNEIVLYAYFGLIVKQWNGLFVRFGNLEVIIPLLALTSLLAMTLFARTFNPSQNLTLFGVLPIGAYIIFIVWIRIANNQILNEPTVQIYEHKNMYQMAGTVASGFSVHNFYIQFLKQSKQQDNHMRLLAAASISALAAYLLIGVFGARGLVGLQASNSNPQTVLEYFSAESWQPFLLSCIYLVHLYSVWPEWVRINTKRFTQIINREKSEPWEFAYACVSALAAFILNVFQVKIESLLAFNGNVLLLLLVYLIPVWLHFKCLLDQQTLLLPEKEQDNRCDQNCQMLKKKPKFVKIAESGVLLVMLAYGLTILYQTLTAHAI